jgi:TonB family protein
MQAMIGLRLIFAMGLLIVFKNSFGQANPDSIPASYVDSVVIIDDRVTIAHFPGGDDELMKYLKKTIKYPKKAADAKISGMVKVKFTIAKDGSIKSVSLFSGAHPILDSVALEALKSMPDWIPGTSNQNPVAQTFIQPLEFRLSNPKKSKLRDWLNNLFRG